MGITYLGHAAAKPPAKRGVATEQTFAPAHKQHEGIGARFFGRIARPWTGKGGSDVTATKQAVPQRPDSLFATSASAESKNEQIGRLRKQPEWRNGVVYRAPLNLNDHVDEIGPARRKMTKLEARRIERLPSTVFCGGEKGKEKIDAEAPNAKSTHVSAETHVSKGATRFFGQLFEGEQNPFRGVSQFAQTGDRDALPANGALTDRCSQALLNLLGCGVDSRNFQRRESIALATKDLPQERQLELQRHLVEWCENNGVKDLGARSPASLDPRRALQIARFLQVHPAQLPTRLNMLTDDILNEATTPKGKTQHIQGEIKTLIETHAYCVKLLGELLNDDRFLELMPHTHRALLEDLGSLYKALGEAMVDEDGLWRQLERFSEMKPNDAIKLVQAAIGGAGVK